jgi:hypothetical protein
MTIKSSQISVGTTATALVANDEFPEEVHIHITSGVLYLGGPDVTSSNGYRLDPNTEIIISNHENAIYGVAGSGTTTVYVMVLSR